MSEEKIRDEWKWRWGRNIPTMTTFDLDVPGRTKIPVIVKDDEDFHPTNHVVKLLRYHQTFWNDYFKKTQTMAGLVTIPKKLAIFLVPTSSSCLYAQATKRSWRSRNLDNTEEARKPTKPGDCISVNQLVLLTPGLVAQMIRVFTMTHYKYATIRVDQSCRL